MNADDIKKYRAILNEAAPTQKARIDQFAEFEAEFAENMSNLREWMTEYRAAKKLNPFGKEMLALLDEWKIQSFAHRTKNLQSHIYKTNAEEKKRAGMVHMPGGGKGEVKAAWFKTSDKRGIAAHQKAVEKADSDLENYRERKFRSRREP